MLNEQLAEMFPAVTEVATPEEAAILAYLGKMLAGSQLREEHTEQLRATRKRSVMLAPPLPPLPRLLRSRVENDGSDGQQRRWSGGGDRGRHPRGAHRRHPACHAGRACFTGSVARLLIAGSIEALPRRRHVTHGGAPLEAALVRELRSPIVCFPAGPGTTL